MQLHDTGCLICILQRSAQGEVLAGAWYRGFMQGVRLTPEQWRPAFQHELGRFVLFPIAAAAADERAMDLFCPVEGQVWESAPDLVIAVDHPFGHRSFPTSGQTCGRKTAPAPRKM